MSTASTIRMIEAYRELAPTPMFLSSFFKLDPRNVHQSEKVEVDIMRDDEDVAIPLPDITVGPRQNEATKYQNKSFTPTIFDEQGAIIAWNLIKKQFGENPFQDPDFAKAAGEEAQRIIVALMNKISRATELMSAQVLQTGLISLIDNAGNVVYSCDFGMRAAHKITTTAWAADGSTGDPPADISSAALLVRRNGKRSANQLIFGKVALQRFKKNVNVKPLFDKTMYNLGQLQPKPLSSDNEDATYHGNVWIDNYEYEIWSYTAEYKHQQTGTMTPYVADNKVVVRSSRGRMDMTYGTIPMFVRPENRPMSFLPPRVTLVDKGIDLTTNAWVTADGKHFYVSAGTRPLPVPTAIDTYACLTVF